MITELEAERIEKEFDTVDMDANCNSREFGRRFATAWNHLWSVMEREKNFSDNLGSNILDWQIGNWAGDGSMYLHNAAMYEELILLNEQIQKIKWSRNAKLFYENAKRDIADAYADMGNLEKCYQIYEEYLEKDPLWGWGWIGYWRQLNDNDDGKFEPTMETLYQRVKAGEQFRDKEDLYRELGDEYNTLGNKERADYFYALEDQAKEEARDRRFAEYVNRIAPVSAAKPKKIYPNDPCPCGSGKKYKKCCGKN